MLNVPVKFVDSCVNAYQQTCKRASNCLQSLIQTRYVIQKKRKWFGKDSYSVNAFGEYQLQYDDNMQHILEFLLIKDKISPADYQLLKFYDQSLSIEEVIQDILSRKTDKNTIGITNLEMQLLNEIFLFVEDESVTKEELLNGFKL